LDVRRAHLELSIERLVLPDLPLVHRERVAAALEAELARLWAEQGLPPGVGGGASIVLNASGVQVAAGARPEAIGARVAQSVYGDLAGGEGPPGRMGGSRT
jgi:hypothetical protein